MGILDKLFGEEKRDQRPAAEGSQPQASARPIHVTDADFDKIILQADRPAVVDMWAEWCGPCHMIAPAVENLAAEYDGRAIVAKLNVDENPQTPARFGIMGIPTLLYFKDGQEVDRQVGVASFPQLAAKLERLLD